MANPFEDPDVQQSSQNNDTGYGGGGAYGDDNASSTPLNQAQQDFALEVGTQVMSQVGTQVATQVGSQVANQVASDIKQDYAKSTTQQADVYSAPETPNFITNCIMWLPIRTVAWIGGIALIVAPWIDHLFFIEFDFIDIIISLYLVIFGIIMVFIESPTFKLTRPCQLKIFFQMRILSRMYGRAFFYIFFAVLCFTRWFTIVTCVGFYLILLSLLMLFSARQAGVKYRRMFEFIAAGADALNIEELQGKFIRKFDELDRSKEGKIGSLEIVALANQAGRKLSNSERHAIQTFLDESCNGYVSKEDFVKQFLQNNGSPESGCCWCCCRAFYM